MQNYNLDIFAQLGGFLFLIIALVAWSIVWKALALWRAARAGNKGWFVVFLLVNTAGILEIIYLFALNKTPTETNVM